MNHTDYITQALIEDENMPADLAALYPAASKIADAASTFIDKADQTIAKKNLAGQKAEIVAKCIDICQHVVKEGARPSAACCAIQPTACNGSGRPGNPRNRSSRTWTR